MAAEGGRDVRDVRVVRSSEERERGEGADVRDVHDRDVPKAATAASPTAPQTIEHRDFSWVGPGIWLPVPEEPHWQAVWDPNKEIAFCL